MLILCLQSFLYYILKHTVLHANKKMLQPKGNQIRPGTVSGSHSRRWRICQALFPVGPVSTG